jgi:hypothetical protein
MAIAQVIGSASQFEGIGASDVQQLFGAGADAHDAPVFGLQAFTVIQRWLTALQKQPNVFALGTETAQTAFAPGFEVQVQLGGPDGLRVDSAMNHQHRKASSNGQCSG